MQLSPVTTHQVLEAFDPNALQLIIFPTEACNFRCTYCYEDFALDRMAPHVVESIKRLLDARAPDLHRLHISWFGGEPLLARPTVLDIGDHARHLRDHYGFDYTADMTTNGSFLDGPTMVELVEKTATTAYQVSLDGDADHHGLTRPNRAGRNTFDAIWNNLLALRELPHDFTLVIRLHLTADNHASAARLVDRYNNELGRDPRFSIFFKEIERLGGPNDATLSLLTGAARAAVQKELRARLHPQDRPFQLTQPGEPYICYASKPNSIAIRADGAVAKCTVALRQANNALGHLGADGTLEIDQLKFRHWLRGWENLDARTLSCPWAATPQPNAEPATTTAPAP